MDSIDSTDLLWDSDAILIIFSSRLSISFYTFSNMASYAYNFSSLRNRFSNAHLLLIFYESNIYNRPLIFSLFSNEVFICYLFITSKNNKILF